MYCGIHSHFTNKQCEMKSLKCLRRLDRVFQGLCRNKQFSLVIHKKVPTLKFKYRSVLLIITSQHIQVNDSNQTKPEKTILQRCHPTKVYVIGESLNFAQQPLTRTIGSLGFMKRTNVLQII